ncbi:MAG: hypothetical protein ACI9ON_001203 [Limisphaerales bacterium]|jgi:hypothetical protein
MSDHRPDNTDDPELDALYRSAGSAQPPKHLDDAILALAAKKPDAAPKLRWAAPLASAAIVLLAVGVFVNQPQESAVEIRTESQMELRGAMDVTTGMEEFEGMEGMEIMPVTAAEPARQSFNLEPSNKISNKLSRTASTEADSIEEIAVVAPTPQALPALAKPKSRFRALQSFASVRTRMFEHEDCQPLLLPEDATGVIKDEFGGTFRTQGAEKKVQCESGEWVHTDIPTKGQTPQER